MIFTTTTHLSEKKGFTFVELVVVIFIFSILLTGAIDIFVQAQRAQRKVAALEKLQDDARFLMQTITQSFQLGSLDFDCYQRPEKDKALNLGLCGDSIDTLEGNGILGIKTFEGKTILFAHSSLIGEGQGKCIDEESAPCVMVAEVSSAGEPSWTPASSQGVRVETLQFYLSPDKNPFVLNDQNEYISNAQPRVTVVFGATAQIKRFKETAKTFVQTTISSREYKR